jgi:hypothetical protein
VVAPGPLKVLESWPTRDTLPPLALHVCDGPGVEEGVFRGSPSGISTRYGVYLRRRSDKKDRNRNQSRLSNSQPRSNELGCQGARKSDLELAIGYSVHDREDLLQLLLVDVAVALHRVHQLRDRDSDLWLHLKELVAHRRHRYSGVVVVWQAINNELGPGVLGRARKDLVEEKGAVGVGYID